MKYIPVSNLCRGCAAKKAGEKRSLSNSLINLNGIVEKTTDKENIITKTPKTNDLVVTKAVEKRLKNDAESHIPTLPPLRYEDIADWVKIAYYVLLAFCSWFVLSNKINVSVLLTLIAAGILLHLVINVILAEPRRERRKQIVERQEQITSKIRELAKERQQKINEREQFYSSPEWGKLREQVIKERGRVCAECGRRIASENDITVDHKLPRSKYPELALAKENLHVLCRKCNSRKGIMEWEG